MKKKDTEGKRRCIGKRQSARLVLEGQKNESKREGESKREQESYLKIHFAAGASPMPALFDEGFDRCGHDCSPNRRRDLCSHRPRRSAAHAEMAENRRRKSRATVLPPAALLLIMRTLPVCRRESYQCRSGIVGKS